MENNNSDDNNKITQITDTNTNNENGNILGKDSKTTTRT